MSNIVLPERCDRAVAETLLPDLINAMSEDPIIIDGGRVQQIGQSMLQVLVAAKHSAGGADITPSPSIIDAAQLAGLSAELFNEVPK